MMHSKARSLLAVAALVLLATAGPLSAQETVRIRGTLERLDGPVLIVKSRDGGELEVTVTDAPVYVALVRASAVDIKPGMFVGDTGVPQPDGTLQTPRINYGRDGLMPPM